MAEHDISNLSGELYSTPNEFYINTVIHSDLAHEIADEFISYDEKTRGVLRRTSGVMRWVFEWHRSRKLSKIGGALLMAASREVVGNTEQYWSDIQNGLMEPTTLVEEARYIADDIVEGRAVIRFD